MLQVPTRQYQVTSISLLALWSYPVVVWQVLWHWVSFSLKSFKSGRNTWVFHPHSSWHLHCQTHHSSWVQKTEWLTASLQKTHSRLQPPDGLYIEDPNHAYGEILQPLLHQMWRRTLLCHFSPQPKTSLSGWDHKRSQRRPWSGTSVGLIICRICSIDWRSGDKPPWQQNIFLSTMAAIGKQLKQSVNVFTA